MANLPVLCMFAGRNNVFIWATGWPYATFNLFHRHIGRIITLEAIAHSVSYTVLYLHYDEGCKLNDERFFSSPFLFFTTRF